MRTVTSFVCALVAACTIAVLIAACGDGGSGSSATTEPQGPSLAGLRCSGPQQSGWCWQRPRPHGIATRDVYFLDIANGWLVGDHGLAMRSTDRGATWLEQPLPTSESLVQVRFTDAQHGWIAAARNGALWRTVDGGLSWSATTRAPVPHATQLWVVRERTLVLTGYDERDANLVSAVSEDGGQTWRLAALVVHNVEPDGTLWGYSGMTRSRDFGKTAISDREPGWPHAFPSEYGFGDAGYAWVRFYEPAGHLLRMLLAQRAGTNQPWVSRTLDMPATQPALFFSNVKLGADGSGLAIASPYENSPIGTPKRFARTSTGGADWRWIEVPAHSAGRGVVADELIDANTLLVALDGAPNVSYHLTIDGGLTWRSLPAQFSRGSNALRMHRDRSGALLASKQEGNGGRRWRSTDQGETWIALPGLDSPDDDIVGLWMTREGRGLAVTQAGTVFDTEDFGQRWTARVNRIAQEVSGLYMKDDGRGWLVADGGLHRTTDGGMTWTAQAVSSLGRSWLGALLWDDGINLRAEAVADCPPDGGTIRTCHTVLHSSSDGGHTWTEGPILRYVDGMQVRAVGFASADLAVVVDGVHLRRSTDGGKTWVDSTLPPMRGSASRIVFQDNRRGWMIGYDGGARRTLDGGISWTVVDLPLPASRHDASLHPWLKDIAFASNDRGWIVGDDGLVLATLDGGTTWTAQASGTPYRLSRLSVLNSGTAWVGGANTSLLATTSGGRPAQ
jgi:photosystem II stability/assembly factor-like uncharacterized protein